MPGSGDMFPDTYTEYVIADLNKRREATLEWVAMQDKEILQEILEHAGMVVILCSCGLDMCQGFRLCHPLLMPEGSLAVYDKNGVI